MTKLHDTVWPPKIVLPNPAFMLEKGPLETNKEDFLDISTAEQNAKEVYQSARLDIASELTKASDRYGSSYDARIAWEDLSGMSERTFIRYVKGESTPTGANIVNTYKFIFNTTDTDEVINKLPDRAKELYLDKIRLGTGTPESISEIIKKSSHHFKLFVMTMNGNSIKKSSIKFEWGNSIMPAFNELLENEIIEEVEPDIYKRGRINSNFCEADVLTLSKGLCNEMTLEDFINDKATAYFSKVNLSEIGLVKAQKIIENAFRDIHNVELSHKGEFELVASFLGKQYNNKELQ